MDMFNYYLREYKQGRKKNFFVRQYDGFVALEKITKSCSFMIKSGSDQEIKDYLKSNNYEFVGLVRMHA